MKTYSIVNIMDEDKIINKLLEHDKRFEDLTTEVEFGALRSEILHGQDEMMIILKRLDEERVFTLEWVKRLEQELEDQRQKLTRHDIEIKEMKEKLKIA